MANDGNMKISAYTDRAYKSKHGEVIELQLNPQTVKYGKKILYNEDRQIGAIGGGTTFERYKPETLSFEFNIDCTGIVPETKESDSAYSKVTELEDTLYIYNSEGHRPSYVMILYGMLIFKGQLSEMKVDYELFDKSGVPFKAKVSCSFIGFRDGDEERKMFSKLSPDMSRHVTLKASDSLLSICHEIYDESQLVTQVARFNNLVGFRYIPIGTELLLPPLKK